MVCNSFELAQFISISFSITVSIVMYQQLCANLNVEFCVNLMMGDVYTKWAKVSKVGL